LLPRLPLLIAVSITREISFEMTLMRIRHLASEAAKSCYPHATTGTGRFSDSALLVVMPRSTKTFERRAEISTRRREKRNGIV